MTDFLSRWLMGMVIIALGCTMALALTPESRVKSVLKMACTLAIAVVMLTPVMNMDMDSYAHSLAKYRETIQAAETAGAQTADRLVRTVIESECEAYISDKGAGLGLGAVPVEVRAKWGDAIWYPYEVWLEVEPSQELIHYIEGELGIPRERMHWSDETKESK